MLVTYFVPSLMILFVPIVLAMYTAGCVYEHGSFERSGPIILLNITLAVSIGVIILDKQVSTLTTMAIVSYGFIAILVVGVVIGVLALKVWVRISRLLPLQLTAVRNDRPNLSKSYSQ